MVYFGLGLVRYVLFPLYFKGIFSQTNRALTMNFPSTLEGFGYGFNDEGKLRKLDKKTKQLTDELFDFNVYNDQSKNQLHYEALGETITDYVYELLEKNGLHRLYIPDSIPKDEATFVFASQKKLENPKKLLVLIHGTGVVRAGQWSRSLIINHSLNHGTQIPYVKKARELGYEVLILNTNDNYRTIKGKEQAIPGNNSPRSHAISVWEKYVLNANPESVSIVAHSYGGIVTVELAKHFPDFFKKKVFAVGFTDSVHSRTSSNDGACKFLKSIGRNWVTSSKLLDEKLSESDSDLPRYSAGHTKHEWTSYACMPALFDFFESRYNQFTKLHSGEL